RYRTVQRSNDIMPVRIFAEPDLFALEQYRFLIVFIIGQAGLAAVRDRPPCGPEVINKVG
ncbi:hypothetical protein, partial [Neisseria bergeri]